MLLLAGTRQRRGASKYSWQRLVPRIHASKLQQALDDWSFIAPQLEETFGRKARYAGRDASASPAVGTLAVHRLELAALLKQAFTS